VQSLIERFVRWLFRHLLSFLFIVAVLLGGKLFWQEYLRLNALHSEVQTLANVELEVAAFLVQAEGDLSLRLADMASASGEKLASEIARTEAGMQQQEQARQSIGKELDALLSQPPTDAVLARARLDAQVELLRQERDYLLRLKTLKARLADTEKLRLLQAKAQQKLLANEAELARQQEKHARLKESSGVWGALPWRQEKRELERLEADMARLQREHGELDTGAKAAADAVKRMSATTAGIRHFELQKEPVYRPLALVKEAMASREQKVHGNWVGKVSGPVMDILPTAIKILLGIIFIPFCVKALFYFVLVPVAARRPPVRLLPDASGAIERDSDGEGGENDTKISSVSRQIRVSQTEELLVHPEYIQSSSTHGHKDTKWFLDYGYILTSMASGMVALTRIRPAQPETIVLSATKDPLSEIGVLSLPAGSSMVLQPRSLIGILVPRNQPVHITSHWRLFSLHAWLTLQLRYLVFHGPVKLIVKGCRGVRVETGGFGRRVNQAAMIGFSANLQYSTARCETFASYLLGKQDLLNNSFSGDTGFYVYEEMPHSKAGSGLTGRSLHGMSDSMLKMFGM